MSLSLPSAILQSSPTPSAAKVLALIESEEGEYQTSLTETYQNMSEKTYKSLRRALPMTRSKMDWDKVMESIIHCLPGLTKTRFWVTSLGRNCPLEKEAFHDFVGTYISYWFTRPAITRPCLAESVCELSASRRAKRVTCSGHFTQSLSINTPQSHLPIYFWDPSNMQSPFTAKRNFTLKDKQKLLANLDIEGTVIAVQPVPDTARPSSLQLNTGQSS